MQSLDLLSVPELVDAIVAGQADVVSVVRAAESQLSAAVELLTAAYDRGGRLILMGAGTSGRLAVMEASEVPGTYGIDEERIQARVAVEQTIWSAPMRPRTTPSSQRPTSSSSASPAWMRWSR
jgi:N-acetylmuramic acid 6-phosphate etherase